jgi:glycine dehydrogenase
MVSDMTGLDVANASLLDEGTAAAEAMSLCVRHNKRKKIFVSSNIHPQTLSVVQTRLSALEVEVIIGAIDKVDLSDHEYAGILLQYPDTFGDIQNFEKVAAEAKKNGVSLDIIFIFHEKD